MVLQVRRVRMARGVTLAALSRLTGIPAPTLSRIERSIYPAYPGWRKRIARAMKLPEAELFERVPADEEATRR